MQNGLALDRGFNIENGFNFINRVLTTSLPSGFGQNRALLKPERLSRKNIDTLYSFYSLEIIEGKIVSFEYHLKKGDSISKRVKVLKDSRWEDITPTEFILKNGRWQKSPQSYKIARKGILIDSLFHLKTLKSEDISGEFKLNGETFSIPKGGRVHENIIYQLKDIYTLNHKVEDISLRDFIKKYSKNSWFDGFCCGGVSFGDVKKNQKSGKLWYLTKSKGKKAKIISKDAGKWQIKNIDGVDVLIVDIKGYDRRIYSNIQKSLYSGKIMEKTSREWVSYNKIAFEAVKEAL